MESTIDLSPSHGVYLTGTPHPLLRPFVKRYQGYSEYAAQTQRRLTVPIERLPLILGFGAPLQIRDPRDDRASLNSHSNFIAGLQDSYGSYEWQGPSQGVQVDVTPIGAYLFLGQPTTAITNGSVELEDLLGRSARELQEGLAYALDWPARFALVDRYLAQRIATARPPAPAVAWAWRKLSNLGGRVSVTSLAADIGWSRRHFIDQFREQIGLAPKMLSRVIRFNRVLGLLEGPEQLDWTTIAQRCGYYDQPHLIKDFVRFSGRTPGEFLRNRVTNGVLPTA